MSIDEARKNYRLETERYKILLDSLVRIAGFISAAIFIFIISSSWKIILFPLARPRGILICLLSCLCVIGLVLLVVTLVAVFRWLPRKVNEDRTTSSDSSGSPERAGQSSDKAIDANENNL